jgi:hypothetical protein
MALQTCSTCYHRFQNLSSSSLVSQKKKETQAQNKTVPVSKLQVIKEYSTVEKSPIGELSGSHGVENENNCILLFVHQLKTSGSNAAWLVM